MAVCRHWAAIGSIAEVLGAIAVVAPVIVHYETWQFTRLRSELVCIRIVRIVAPIRA
jgi:hypothetical protein